jgi:hypothetical protein
MAGRLGERLSLTRIEALRDRLFPEPPQSTRSPVPAFVLFALVIVLYPAHQLLTQGSMLLRGQMWAEMATNYYANAVSMPWYEQLFSTDAGYIPFPQRVAGLLGTVLDLPITSIPYYYSAVAVLGAAVLAGAVCLPIFRTVLPNDYLRFAVAMATLLVADYQTRTYINFTYFVILLALFIAAWALLERRREAPLWMWVLPFLMLSKPAVLTVLPVIVLAALVSRRRFRFIAAVTLLAGLVQFVQLVISLSSSMIYQGSDSGILSKVFWSLAYFVGWLGRLVVGSETGALDTVFAIAGVVVLLGLAALVAFARSSASALVVAAVTSILFAMLLNGVSFSSTFGGSLDLVAADPERRLIGSAIGLFAIAAALLSALFEHPAVVRRRDALKGLPWLGGFTTALAVGLFAIWFGASGWLGSVAAASTPLAVGSADVSQWQNQAGSLASDDEIVCIPIGPFGWVYGRDCRDLGAGPASDNGVQFSGAPAQAVEQTSYTLDVPEAVKEASVAAIGIMVKPVSGSGTVSGRIELVTESGQVVRFDGLAEVQSGGGLVQFGSTGSLPVDRVVGARALFDQPVEVGTISSGEGRVPAVLWLGR